MFIKVYLYKMQHVNYISKKKKKRKPQIFRLEFYLFIKLFFYKLYII